MRVRQILFGLLLLPFTFSYLTCFVSVLGLVVQYWQILATFIFGIFSYLVLYFIFFRKYSPFWSTLEHEVTHILFAMVMLKPIRWLIVSDDLGGLTVLGEKKNFLIALAPYFFPTISMALLLLKPIVQPSFYQYYLFVVGLSLGYHLLSSLNETRTWQPDIQSYGTFLSFVFIILMNCICLSCIILVLLDGWGGFWLFLQDGFWQVVEFLIHPVTTPPAPVEF